MLTALQALLPHMQARAAALDSGAAFPAADIAELRELGLLAAPLPRHLGGLGIGTEPVGWSTALAMLMACGTGNLAVARLWEAHINALRLAIRFGSEETQARVAADALGGELYGLWVTDLPGQAPLALVGDRLRGTKGPCSGAGHCTRALVTAETDHGRVMAIIELSGTEPIQPIDGLHGMRAAANGLITLDGVRVRDWLGGPGDYLREPDFSCGAWRASAGAAGALAGLVDVVGAGLRSKHQVDAPLQLARYGALLVARDTARLWLERAARIAEAEDGDPAEQVATVNLARTAVETACLDAIRHTQRSLGLAAFVAPHPAERIMRDLATYLRQPAPDAALLEAAAWHLRG